MSKLNIIEAMKMPIGTEFEVFSTTNRKANTNMILRENDNDKKYLEWANNEPLKVFEFLMDITFIPIQQPVSFMEVVAKAKTNRFRIEHELLKGHSDLGHTLLTTLNILARYFNNDEITDILLNGKCYIEESEELEDERLS